MHWWSDRVWKCVERREKFSGQAHHHVSIQANWQMQWVKFENWRTNCQTENLKFEFEFQLKHEPWCNIWILFFLCSHNQQRLRPHVTTLNFHFAFDKTTTSDDFCQRLHDGIMDNINDPTTTYDNKIYPDRKTWIAMKTMWNWCNYCNK